MNKAKQKILYGAGAMGKRAFEYFTKEHPDSVYCFVDRAKHGTIYCDKPVISFEEFIKIANSEEKIKEHVLQAKRLYESDENFDTERFDEKRFRSYVQMRFTLNLLEDYHNWLHDNN